MEGVPSWMFYVAAALLVVLFALQVQGITV